ncbi:MAG: AI-2E family transporter [Deltaproteobacteria bacterium]|nr:AI-2E family transporter [Deltaproteobacteria bacterium]
MLLRAADPQCIAASLGLALPPAALRPRSLRCLRLGSREHHYAPVGALGTPRAWSQVVELTGPQEGERGRGRWIDYGFFAALALAALLFYRTIEPVLVPVVVGAFAAVLTFPYCRHIARVLGGRQRSAAALATLGVIMVAVIPSVLLGWALVQEISAAAQRITAHLASGGAAAFVEKLPIPSRWKVHPPEQLQAVGNALAARAGQLVSTVLAKASAMVMGAFLFVLSLYYFLIEGTGWLKEAERLAPMDPGYVRAFEREFVNVSHALFYGTAVTAIVQGIVAGLGYRLLGVPQPILWGAATSFMSLTPVIGTTIVWLPIGVGMAIFKSPIRGVGVIAWGLLVTGTIDNFIRPMLMKGRMRLHPLVVFLAVLGGVAAFGMVGIFVGPLAAALFLAALRIYDRDYRAKILGG